MRPQYCHEPILSIANARPPIVAIGESAQALGLSGIRTKTRGQKRLIRQNKPSDKTKRRIKKASTAFFKAGLAQNSHQTAAWDGYSVRSFGNNALGIFW
jgi:hypothetical protein